MMNISIIIYILKCIHVHIRKHIHVYLLENCQVKRRKKIIKLKIKKNRLPRDNMYLFNIQINYICVLVRYIRIDVYVCNGTHICVYILWKWICDFGGQMYIKDQRVWAGPRPHFTGFSLLLSPLPLWLFYIYYILYLLLPSLLFTFSRRFGLFTALISSLLMLKLQRRKTDLHMRMCQKIMQ